MPAWIANLPPEIRRAVSTGDLDTVPAPYRELVRRYQRFLLEKPPETK